MTFSYLYLSRDIFVASEGKLYEIRSDFFFG